jgi:hypothetical protein
VRWAIATTVAIVVLLAIASLALAWGLLGNASLPDKVIGLAATAQAVAAFLVGILSAVLAWIAVGALRAARRQADAASAAASEARNANLEIRIERELSVLPVLSAVAQQTWHGDGTLGLEITAVNWSAHPALRVSVQLLVGPWDGMAPVDPKALPHGVAGSPKIYEVVPKDDPKTFGFHIKTALPDVIVARMVYSGPLGATVWQTYELVRADRSFTGRQRYIQPSVPGAAPIVSGILVQAQVAEGVGTADDATVDTA